MVLSLLPPPKDGGKDVFVYAKAFEKSGVPSIDDGDALGFEIESDSCGRGSQATNLQLD